MATAIFNGVAQGAQPLISQCYGKNEMAGAKKLLLLGCGTALALAAVLYGAVFGFTDTFVALFNSESSALMAEYAHSGMRIYFLGYFFAGCNIVAAGYLGAVNRPTEATITSVSRGVAAIVTCSLILSALFVVGLPRRRGHHAGPDGVPAQAPAVCVRLSASTKKSRVLPRLLNILNIQCLLPLVFRRAEGPRCLTGQGPPLCGGLAGLFFEHPAQVVGP